MQTQYLLDRTGVWASTLCAIHCLALPVISFPAFTGLALLHSHGIENTILLFSAGLALCSLVPAYIKHHRKVFPMVVCTAGFFLMTLGRFSVNESVLAFTGASLVGSGHLFNYRLCKRANNHKNT